MSKATSNSTGWDDTLTKVVYEATRSFVARYYSDNMDLFQLLWEASKNHLESISQKRGAMASLLPELGFTGSDNSTRIAEAIGMVSKLVSEVTRPSSTPSYSSIETTLRQILKERKIGKPLSDEIVKHLIPLTGVILGMGEQQGTTRKTLISGRYSKPKTDREIRKILMSKQYPLAVDEKYKIITMSGLDVNLGSEAKDFLVPLLRSFTIEKKKNIGLSYDELAKAAWDLIQPVNASQIKAISQQLRGNLPDELRESIENISKWGYKFNLTARIRRFFLATDEAAD